MSDTLTYTRENPFASPLLRNVKLNKEGSQKDTRHLELDLNGSDITYNVGDSLGVWPQNDPGLVEALLGKCDGKPEDIVKVKESELSLREALESRLDLQKITRYLVPNLLECATSEADKSRLESFTQPDQKQAFRSEYLDVLDVWEACPSARLSPQKLVDSLGTLTPRLYSIASSQKSNPREVHLTVALESTRHKERLRLGVCSNFMGGRVPLGEPMPVYVHAAKHFSLPDENGVPIIMVGPGTGVAPFRAFLQERQARGDSGKNWLFFGEQRRQFDFLYEEEFTRMQKDGFLTRLDLAFSRDQDHKIYVQDKIRENAGEFWRWLEEGAVLYVCGDAKRMAKDVEMALHDIIAEAGGKSEDEAKEYVKNLKKEKRYLKDVY